MTTASKHIDQFNNLDGRTVSVDELKAIKYRIDSSLKKEYNFDLAEISRRLDVGISKAGGDEVKVKIESVARVAYHPDQTSFYGVECIQDDKDYDGQSLDGISDTTYKVVTDKILELMKSDGLVWRKPWKMNVSSSSNLAHNYKTKTVYRGTNFYLNWMNYPAPYFFTFKQVTDAGGKVKAGEKGNPIVYFKWLYKDLKKHKLVDAKVALDKNGKLKEGFEQIPGLFYYNVFNHSQTEGITIKAKPSPPRSEEEKIESAEAIVKGMPQRPPIKNQAQDRAFYSPHYDSVTMPLVSYFDGKPQYYAVLFHELIHATGSPRRLGRDMTGRQFDKKYCFEELIAEIGACFLSAESGILYHTLKNSAAYVKGYYDSVLAFMKGDARFFLNACSAAQKAADFILGEPAKKQKRESFKPKSRGSKIRTGENLIPGNKVKLMQVKAKGSWPEHWVLQINNYTENFLDEAKATTAYERAVNRFKKKSSKGKTKVAKPNKAGREPAKRKTPVEPVAPVKSLETVSGLGFVTADQSVERQEGMFTLPGEIGTLLGEQQRYKLEIVIAGETHSSKSELGKQIADAFCSIGDDVAWVDWEQGGLKSKDTKGSVDRNVKTENRKRFHVSSEVKRSKEALKSLSQHFKVIAVDSGTKLKEVTNAWIDELREECPNTVWIILMQQNAKGVARGGPAAEYDAPVVLKTYRPDESDFTKNYAYVFKNRGNKTGLYYNISEKKILTRNPEDPEPEPVVNDEPKAHVTL